MNELTGTVVDCCIKLHRDLGNGLMPGAYRLCLAHFLRGQGLKVAENHPVHVQYDEISLGTPIRVDLLVEGEIVLEVVTAERINAHHEARILSHLRLGSFRLGLLMNFHAPLMKDGIKRIINPLCRERPAHGSVRNEPPGPSTVLSQSAECPLAKHGPESRPVSDLDLLCGRVIALCIKIHKVLGNGLDKEAYEICLSHELQKAGLKTARQVAVPLVYAGVDLGCPYRLDILVEDSLVLELKAVEQIRPIHMAQLLSYLRLGGYRLGLLLNFGGVLMRDGIQRLINSRLDGTSYSLPQ